MTRVVTEVFNAQFAAEYDERFAKQAPIREALHLLMTAVLRDLPEHARILSVGAGTGTEIIALARKFPGWQFTAVEPSVPMLDVCRRRLEAQGIASRCTFHEGYLESLLPSGAFDAATSLLVAHFILSLQDRREYLRAIASRLRPGGTLVIADLAADTRSPDYARLLEVWVRLMRDSGLPPEGIENLRATYERDVALLPPEQLGELIASAGFESPVPFLQTGLIHAWFARRAG